MSSVVFSPSQFRTPEIVNLVLLLALMGAGLLYHFKGWKLDGADLIVVCVLIVNSGHILRAQLSRVSARIDELEKKLSAKSSA